MEKCVEAMMDDPVLHRLGFIHQPTLIIFGQADALIPSKPLSQQSTSTIAKQGASRLPSAQLHLLPNAGHFVHWEAANKVNKLVSAWMKK
jgi:pimeloyl-ACP methyl ester carboxylesterase